MGQCNTYLRIIPVEPGHSQIVSKSTLYLQDIWNQILDDFSQFEPFCPHDPEAP